MKRKLAILLALALCFGITACAEQQTPLENTTPTEAVADTQTSTPPPAEETQPITYTYQVEAMQNADCAYYGPAASVPNPSGTAQGKIIVWSQCPQCFEENIGTHHIDPAELDFSAGDSVMYSGTDSCWDCSWDYDMDQFMWTIRVTRIPK